MLIRIVTDTWHIALFTTASSLFFAGEVSSAPIDLKYVCFWEFIYHFDTSSTAEGGGGSFKIRKPIGEVGCCESRMAERIHWWTDR